MKTLLQAIGAAAFLYAALYFALGREPVEEGRPVDCTCEGEADCDLIIAPSVIDPEKHVQCAVVGITSRCCPVTIHERSEIKP